MKYQILVRKDNSDASSSKRYAWVDSSAKATRTESLIKRGFAIVDECEELDDVMGKHRAAADALIKAGWIVFEF